MNCRNLFLGVVFLVLGAFGGTARGANSGSNFDANSNPAKSYAVLFGVGKFESAKLGELPGAVNDMKALRREWFSAPEFEGRVYSLVDGVNGPNALAPTRENFVATLEKLKGLTNDNDAIYICVSTHGVSAFDRSFLCPKNAVDGDLQDANAENLAEIADAKRLLAVSSLLDKISALKGRKVLIIDACRKNTSNAQANSEVHFLKEFEDRLRGKPHANLAVMASCCLGQKARETIVDNGTFRGLFFLYFLEGLAGNAEFNGAYDGEITLIEAYNYANARTKRAAQALRHEQTPELYEANDARNWNGVDRLVLTKRNLFAQSFDAKSLAQESDALFALHAGDALTQKQKEKEEQRQNVNGDYPTIEALMDYSLNAQPGNRLARKLRGYSRRAQADYAGALDDFQRVDEELTLFVGRDPAFPEYAGCVIYRSATAETNDSKGVPTGARLGVDKVENNRLRVAFLDSKPQTPPFWVSRDAVVWSRLAAETSIAGSAATPSRNSGAVRRPGYSNRSTSGGGSTAIHNPAFN